MKPNWKFTVGMRVKYAARFLRSICDYSADSANRVGTIIEIKDLGGKCPAIAKIKWDDEPDRDPDETPGALLSNLTPADKIHLEHAYD